MHRYRPGHVLCVTRRRVVLRATVGSCRGILNYSRSRLKLCSNADGRRSHHCMFTAMRAVQRPRILTRFGSSRFSCILISRIRRTKTRKCRHIVGRFGSTSFVLNVATAPRHASNVGVFRLFKRGVTCRVHLRGTLSRGVLYPFRCCNITRCLNSGSSPGKVIRHLSISGNLSRGSSGRLGCRVRRLTARGQIHCVVSGLRRCKRFGVPIAKLIFYDQRRRTRGLSRLFGRR